MAKPHIAGGPFHESVVLLVSHEAEGTVGLIVNRATEVALSELLPDFNFKGAEGQTHTLYFGGPVVLDGMMFLFRGVRPPEESKHVIGGVYLSGDRQLLEELLEREESTEELRIYLGHAGWAPGQLESEIARGDWHLVRAQTETVFREDLERLWSELIKGMQTTAAIEG